MFSKKLLSPIFRWYSTSLIRWEPWEDKILTDYVKQNGNKWTAISQHCLPNRSVKQCRARWQNINPDLKKGSFSLNERQLLEEGVEKYGSQWLKIQKEFLPNRNATKLCQEYNYRLGEALREKGWSKEEDKLLLKGVEEFGLKSWAKIARTYLPHRIGKQLMDRYTQVLNPSVKRNQKWSQEECDTLVKRAIIFGQNNWNKVAEGLPGRTSTRCYNKWLQDLDPSLNKGPWSEKETRLLWELLYHFEGAFYKAAEYLPGRNSIKCNKRFKSEMQTLHRLLPDQTIQLETETRKDWIRRMADILRNLPDKNTVLRVKPNEITELHQTASWSDNEAKKLKELIDKITKEKKVASKDQLNKSDWEEIVSHLTGRDVDQCKYYYTEHLKKDNTITEGKRTEEEDKMLSQLAYQDQWTEDQDRILSFIVGSYTKDNGSNISWSKVASMMPGRNAEQCRTRWLSSLQPDTGKRWTYEEEMQLLEIVQKLKLSDLKNIWPTVAKELNTGRNDWQCRRKFSYMQHTGFAI